MSGDYKKAMPVPGPESIPFWEGVKNHQLMVQKCLRCDHRWFPPSSVCTSCGNRDFEWVTLSGKGTVFSFVVFHRVYHKGWEGELPYVVGIVELEEGPRMLSNIIEVPAENVKCDMPVRVVFDDVTDQLTLPKFKPV
tara:strand:+ start:522 stop:932 length:411 start_codon:yes stop_codon:yes gene_type:complete